MAKEIKPKRIEIYKTKEGKCPFRDWFDDLRDRKAQYKISTRLDRVEEGNFGECNSIGSGVHELKINYGPGYRIYFGQKEEMLVVLLCGGDKRTQNKDIEKALEYWADWRQNG